MHTKVIFVMKKISEKVRKQLVGLCFAAMGIQILIGLLWMCCNIGSGQFFSVSGDYLANADRMHFDEYSGILYVLLIRFSLSIEKIAGIPYHIFVSVFQLLFAFMCGCCFFKYLRKEDRAFFSLGNIVGSLYLMTIPMLMQSHLSVRPESLIAMLFLVMLGFSVKCRDGKEWKTSVLSCGAWFLMAMLDRTYIFLGAVPLLVQGVRLIREKNKYLIKYICVFVLSAGLICILDANVLKPSEDKIQRTTSGAMVSRFVWPWFEQSYFFWPDEIKAVMPTELAFDISGDAEDVMHIFGPLVEKEYGRERAAELYMEMAKSSVMVRTKGVLENIGRDFGAYLWTPFSLEEQLDGTTHKNYGGWNYKVMCGETPKLGKVYVHYSLNFIKIAVVGVLLFVIITGIDIARKRTGLKRIRWESVMWIVVVLSQALWFTMAAAGRMDYLNVPVITVAWYLCPVWMLKKLIKSEF